MPTWGASRWVLSVRLPSRLGGGGSRPRQGCTDASVAPHASRDLSLSSGGSTQIILLFSLLFYLPGLLCLTLSAAVPGLKAAAGQSAASSAQGLFWAG